MNEAKEYPVEDAFKPGILCITWNYKVPWDKLTWDMYENGAVVLELDDEEVPIRAFKK